jgi:hypothetical protein
MGGGGACCADVLSQPARTTVNASGATNNATRVAALVVSGFSQTLCERRSEMRISEALMERSFALASTHKQSGSGRNFD